MIEREQKVNNEAISATITNYYDAIQRDSSSKNGSMSGLQEKAREDSSSNSDTNSFDEDWIYDNGEPWGNKTLTLSQIIWGKFGGIFPINISTLHAFS